MSGASLLRALALASALATPQGTDEPTPLESGREVTGTIALTAPGTVCYRLSLPSDVVAFDLRLSCPLADLDLYATLGEHPEELERADWGAFGEDGEERLTAHRLSDDRLEGGDLFLCVSYGYEAAPVVGGRPLEQAPFRLVARAFAARVDAELTAGLAQRSALDADSGGFRTFAVDVPEGAAALRVDLFDVAGDLDLFARHRVRVLSNGPLLASAQNPWGAETLLITPQSEPPLRPGRWYVQVENQIDPLESAAFAIRCSLSEDVPAELLGLPALGPPAGAQGLARALPGVFELFCGPLSGSGTCVTPDGWFLTNAHVVDTGRDDPVVLCAPLARGLPPRESFRGEVALLDRERDLALVRVLTGFRGEAIPPDYAFPALDRADVEQLAMGDPLLLAGYPSIGGQKSRVSISLSRGIVSGFERYPYGLLIKTDAQIESGSSGGAALDERGRLLGVPTSKVEYGSGYFGFVQPLSSLPRAWRDLLADPAARRAFRPQR